MNPFNQIDFIFFYLKERSELSADFSKELIWNYVEKTAEIGINRQLFEEILQRLLEDGYIKEIVNPETQPTYHLTFNGRVFNGYANKNQSLKLESEWINDLKIQNIKNSRKLNLLTLIIAIGTLIAAIYYILEIRKNWICIYP